MGYTLYPVELKFFVVCFVCSQLKIRYKNKKILTTKKLKRVQRNRREKKKMSTQRTHCSFVVLMSYFAFPVFTCFASLFNITCSRNTNRLGTRTCAMDYNSILLSVIFCCTHIIYYFCASKDSHIFLLIHTMNTLEILVPCPHIYHTPVTSCTFHCFALVKPYKKSVRRVRVQNPLSTYSS